MKQPTPQEIVALVACPACRVPKGAPCCWFYGVDEGTVHDERAQEWQFYQDERAKLAKWNAAGEPKP